MAKLITLFCLVLIVGGFISAEAGRVWTRPTPAGGIQTNCGHHGDSCSIGTGCCKGHNCHAYAGKCQATITVDELNNARQRILGRTGPDN